MNQSVRWPQQRIKQLKRWRALSGFGGLVLAASFFMPAVEGCQTPVIPSQEAADIFLRFDFNEIVGIFTMYIFPYLFGLLTFAIAWRSRGYRQNIERTLGISVPLLIAPIVLLLTFCLIVALINGGVDWDFWTIVFTSALLLGIYFCSRSLRMGISEFVCLRWFVALLCGLWFGFWCSSSVFGGGKTYYGIWCSWVGSVLILVAVTAEAKIRSRLEFIDMLWALLTCRLKIYDLEGQRCIECGYLLIGLLSNRCPECGLEFDPAECGTEISKISKNEARKETT